MDCVQVFEEIQQAVRTLRLMPKVYVRNKLTHWPDIVQNFFDAYGYTEATCRIIPTARQIDQLDRVIEWLTWVPGDYAKIIWARAEGMSFGKIASVHRPRIGKTTCYERFRTGVAMISIHLKKTA